MALSSIFITTAVFCTPWIGFKKQIASLTKLYNSHAPVRVQSCSVKVWSYLHAIYAYRASRHCPESVFSCFVTFLFFHFCLLSTPCSNLAACTPLPRCVSHSLLYPHLT